MILLDYVIPRRICAVSLFLLVVLDELIRTILGWPINQNLFIHTLTTTPSTSLTENTSSSTSVIATVLLPFFTNDTSGAAVATGHSVNSTVMSSPNTTDVEHWNDARNGSSQGSGDSFVEDHAGVWVIGVMSGTCILTIAFIVRALFSRAEAFRDPQENIFAQDGMDEQMGMGFGTHNTGPSGSDFGYL